MCSLPVVQKNSAMHRMTFLWMKAVKSNTLLSSLCVYLISLHVLVSDNNAACFCSVV